MKWVTREGAKTNRVACQWLIKKFIDLQPEFLFVPNDKVLKVARRGCSALGRGRAEDRLAGRTTCRGRRGRKPVQVELGRRCLTVRHSRTY